MRIRAATPDEFATVMGLLDAAMLDVDVDRVQDSIESTDGDAVLVAVEDGRVLGAVVLTGRRVDAVAVRPRRRGRGIGSALVECAAERGDGDLVAEFESDVRPFYEALGFEIESVDDGRYRGTLD